MFKNTVFFKNVFWGKGKHMPANCIGGNENMYLGRKVMGTPLHKCSFLMDIVLLNSNHASVQFGLSLCSCHLISFGN